MAVADHLALTIEQWKMYGMDVSNHLWFLLVFTQHKHNQNITCFDPLMSAHVSHNTCCVRGPRLGVT